MTVEQAVKEYEEMFGGFPNMLFMGAPDEYIIWKVQIALRTGKEIVSERDDYNTDV